MRKLTINWIAAACTGALGMLVCGLAAPQAAVVVLAHASQLAYVSYALPSQCGTGRELQHASVHLLTWLDGVDPKLMRRMLTHPDPEVRAACVLVLGGDRTHASYETVVRLLADPDVRVRRSALGAAAEYGDERLLPALIQALKDSDRETQRVALNSLKRYPSNPEAERAIEAWIASRQAPW